MSQHKALVGNVIFHLVLNLVSSLLASMLGVTSTCEMDRDSRVMWVHAMVC